MADVINIGQNVNDGTGDDLRTAFTKVNQKFTELEALGGETNDGVNVGSTGEEIFAGKNGLNLQFRKIRSADPNRLSVSVVNDVIVIDNNRPADAAFRNVQTDGVGTITATTSNSTFAIIGGNNITTEIAGSNVRINGNFALSNDGSPQLGGNLAMDNSDIIGPGNITAITRLQVTGTDTLNPSSIANLDVTNQLRVSGLTTFSNGLTVSGGTIVGNLTGDVTGDITGNIIGGLGANFNTNNYDFVGGGRFQLRRNEFAVEDTAIADGPFYVQLDESEGTVAFRLKTSTNDAPEPFVSIEAHSKTPIQDGFGAGLTFAIGTGTGPGSPLGAIAGRRVSSTINEIGIQPEPGGNAGGVDVQSPPVAVFRSNNQIILGKGDPAILISEGTISSYGQSNSNLKLDADGTGYIDFYSAYQFPRSIGQAGQVLKVPTSGSVLEWGTGGGGATVTAISGVTLSNPLRITTGTAHGLTDTQQITVTDVVGTTELNGNSYYVDVIDSTTVDLYSDDTLSTAINGTVGFSVYVSGGYVTGAAGSGGSGTFVGLADTPNSYAAAQADANKLVQINATGNGLIFTDYNNLINATYIEGKGFLPKTGGTLTGDVISNTIRLRNSDGYILATAFQGNFVGPLSGNADGNHVGTFNGTIGNTTPGTITGTTITATNTFVGNLSGTVTGTLNGNVNGNVTGNVAGNTTGIHFGSLNGNVTATSGASTFVVINTGTINATGNITANSFTGDIASPVLSAFNDVVVTGDITNNSGNVSIADNLDITGNTSITGNVTVTQTLDVAGRGQIADLRIEGNSIESDVSNGNLRLATNGTGFVEIEGEVRLNGNVALSKINEQIIGTTQTPSTITPSTPMTFITTQDWTNASAGLAYANLADATAEGKIKIIKMKNRGRYSLDGVQFFDRYLVVNLTFEGSPTAINVSENSENGTITLIWHDGSWWKISEIDA